jgi:hypothetical protein
MNKNSKDADDKVLNENYNEIIEFLDEYYGKPQATPRPISRFKVSWFDFQLFKTGQNPEYELAIICIPVVQLG